MSDPDAPAKPGKPTVRTWVIGLIVAGVVGIVMIPIAIVIALTVIGNHLDARFERVNAQICAANPGDPACRGR